MSLISATKSISLDSTFKRNNLYFYPKDSPKKNNGIKITEIGTVIILTSLSAWGLFSVCMALSTTIQESRWNRQFEFILISGFMMDKEVWMVRPAQYRLLGRTSLSHQPSEGWPWCCNRLGPTAQLHTGYRLPLVILLTLSLMVSGQSKTLTGVGESTTEKDDMCGIILPQKVWLWATGSMGIQNYTFLHLLNM
jgi:hypothetical protein